MTGLPKTIPVTSEEIMEALDEPLTIICESVHNVLEKTPPELAAEISGAGIVLTGGGAYLWGIDRRIQERTGIRVRIAEDAKSCVAIGTGEALDNLDVIKRSQMNRREIYI